MINFKTMIKIKNKNKKIKDKLNNTCSNKVNKNIKKICFKLISSHHSNKKYHMWFCSRGQEQVKSHVHRIGASESSHSSTQLHPLMI